MAPSRQNAVSRGLVEIELVHNKNKAGFQKPTQKQEREAEPRYSKEKHRHVREERRWERHEGKIENCQLAGLGRHPQEPSSSTSKKSVVVVIIDTVKIAERITSSTF